MSKMGNTMPASTPTVTQRASSALQVLGQTIRARRKALGVNATSAAQSAGMSRVTWHRIENGEPSVTMGAYLNAMGVLDLDMEVAPAQEKNKPQAPVSHEDWIPARVRLADYPQLKRLAWQVHGTDTLTPMEALSIYERNVRHIDPDAVEPHERQLMAALQRGLGNETHV